MTPRGRCQRSLVAGGLLNSQSCSNGSDTRPVRQPCQSWTPATSMASFKSGSVAGQGKPTLRMEPSASEMMRNPDSATSGSGRGPRKVPNVPSARTTQTGSLTADSSRGASGSTARTCEGIYCRDREDPYGGLATEPKLVLPYLTHRKADDRIGFQPRGSLRQDGDDRSRDRFAGGRRMRQPPSATPKAAVSATDSSATPAKRSEPSPRSRGPLAHRQPSRRLR